MRIAIISDIHGNLTALEAVIADLKITSPDLILHGGDIAHGGAHGGAHPAEVLDRIRALGWPGICGNTDEMLWAPESLRDFAAQNPKSKSIFDAVEETRAPTCAWLGKERIAWLKGLPRQERRGPIALVHASPNDLWRAPLPNASNADLHDTYSSLGVPVVVYGHIHQPYVREMPNLTVANTGSVSLSYDGDPRASYLILDDVNAVIRRVEYDLEIEVEALRQSGLPHAEWIGRTLRAAGFVPLT
jgi:predicted phosphodiesterase